MLETTTAATAIATDDDRYAAFRDRDTGARDRFVMAVVTTGIYCRAGCPARLPRRENVRFFDTVDQARRAGFRACLRCRPDGAAPGAEAMETVCRLIEAAETAPSLADLAREVGLSPWHLQRRFKAAMGLSPAAYAAQLRDQRAKAALAAGAAVTDAVYEAGYSAPSRFYETARARLGMTPSAFRNGGRSERLSLAIAPCSLGQVLVAATEKGLAAVELGDDADAMRRRFHARFHAADIVEDDDDLAAKVATVVRLIERPGLAVDLPLDLRGTAFQQRVWAALRAIPPGQVRSYGELAREIGSPGAARAVGAACGANPVGVVVPCHRVVGASGGLTGYAWGPDRKRALLRREGVDLKP